MPTHLNVRCFLFSPLRHASHATSPQRGEVLVEIHPSHDIPQRGKAAANSPQRGEAAANSPQRGEASSNCPQRGEA